MAKRTARPYQAKVINEYFTCLHAGYKAPVIILPTGGGKTLASLRFALLHAQKHQMDRVIYVIP